ncbi:hypothetical protein TcWFU_002174 [Taenia crassiceps]|uniref:Uncharacterized protein n=1 Tax=Taenia crassiceps TaxID=6207 RepID=A0ABR4Q511_9CEST
MVPHAIPLPAHTCHRSQSGWQFSRSRLTCIHSHNAASWHDSSLKLVHKEGHQTMPPMKKCRFVFPDPIRFDPARRDPTILLTRSSSSCLSCFDGYRSLALSLLWINKSTGRVTLFYGVPLLLAPCFVHPQVMRKGIVMSPTRRFIWHAHPTGNGDEGDEGDEVEGEEEEEGVEDEDIMFNRQWCVCVDTPYRILSHQIASAQTERWTVIEANERRCAGSSRHAGSVLRRWQMTAIHRQLLSSSAVACASHELTSSLPIWRSLSPSSRLLQVCFKVRRLADPAGGVRGKWKRSSSMRLVLHRVNNAMPRCSQLWWKRTLRMALQMRRMNGLVKDAWRGVAESTVLRLVVG